MISINNQCEGGKRWVWRSVWWACQRGIYLCLVSKMPFLWGWAGVWPQTSKQEDSPATPAQCSGVICNQLDKRGSGSSDLSQSLWQKDYGAVPCQHVGGIGERGLSYLQVPHFSWERKQLEISLLYHICHNHHQLILAFLFIFFWLSIFVAVSSRRRTSSVWF